MNKSILSKSVVIISIFAMAIILNGCSGSGACAEGEALNGEGVCEVIGDGPGPNANDCPAGFVEDADGDCVPENPCVDGRVLDENDECACDEGSVEDVDGLCVEKTACEEGFVKDGNGNCVAIEISRDCPSGEHWDSDAGECVTDLSGHFLLRPGVARVTYSRLTYALLCPVGQTRNSDGECEEDE